VFPSEEDVAALHEMTLNGDIMGLREQAEALQTCHSRWIPFAERILKLADTFQIRKIQDFLETDRPDTM